MPKFRCVICEQSHDELADIVADEPEPVYQQVSDADRERRVELTPDTCILDNEHYFIRAIIEIPVHDYPHRFGFNVWVSQKKENFLDYVANFRSAAIGPFFGWLMTHIGFYGVDTLSLKTMVHFRGGGLRPTVELEPTDHPLAVDQREGMTFARACEIVHYYRTD